MPRPIKFRAVLPKIKIVNRCIICGKIIPMNIFICSDCKRRMRRTFG